MNSGYGLLMPDNTTVIGSVYDTEETTLEKLKDGHPVWVKEKCYVCAGCINRCPAEAIEYGDKSQGKYRYTFEKYYRKVRTGLHK